MGTDDTEPISDEGTGMEIEIIKTAPDVIRAQDEALIDRQVATAKAYPRSLAQFQSDLRTLVTSDAEFAEECTYSIRREGKRITGPGIRFAEIMLSTYEHLFCDTRVVEEGLRHVTVEATCRDAQRNAVARIQVRRRITKKDGKRFSDDMVTVTINAAISLAMRNAIFRVVPKPLWLAAWRESMEVARGDAKGFVARREAAIEWLTDHGATEERILHYCRKRDIEDLEIDDILDLRQIARQVKEMGIDIDTLLPEPELAHDSKAAKAQARSAAEALKRSGADKAFVEGAGDEGAQYRQDQDARLGQPEPERDPATGEIIPDHVGRNRGDEPQE